MNKTIIAKRFSKAIDTYPHQASVQREIARKMTGLLTQHIATPHPRTIEFGCGTGTYSRMLLQALRPKKLLLNDLCREVESCYGDLLHSPQVSFLGGDAETVSFPDETELITSCSALQWFESPETFFRRCSRLLSHSGYFAFSTFGQENLKEVRQLTGKGLSYLPIEALKESLSADFEILHAEEEIVPLRFNEPIEVLYHLKQTGVTGVGQETDETHSNEAPRPWTRREIRRFCDDYLQTFGSQGAVTLTYHPIYIIAKKKNV